MVVLFLARFPLILLHTRWELLRHRLLFVPGVTPFAYNVDVFVFPYIREVIMVQGLRFKVKKVGTCQILLVFGTVRGSQFRLLIEF